jgi:hypothetical protein
MRALQPGGKLAVLLMATINGDSVFHKLIGLIYTLTGQSTAINTLKQENLLKPFLEQGLSVEIKTLHKDFYSLIFLIASKPGI